MNRKHRVACVGDSITYGVLSTNAEEKSYPAQLQKLLGEDYEVGNFGVGCASLMEDTDLPYCSTPRYQPSLDFDADTVIIMLGTNDSSINNIDKIDKFPEALINFANVYKKGTSDPDVYIASIACGYDKNMEKDIDKRINGIVAPLIKETVSKTCAKGFIDIHKLTSNMPENFVDGVHPNDSCYKLMALHFYKEAFGKTVCRVNLKVEPKALVILEDYSTVADENGDAVLYAAEGKRPLTVIKNGKKTVFSSLFIAANGFDADGYGKFSATIKMENGDRIVTLGMPAVATSFVGDMTPDKAVDGLPDTRFEALGEGEQNLTVMLTEECEVHGARITWEVAFAREYAISVSTDGENFERVYYENNSKGGAEYISFSKIKAKYVRLEMLARGTYYGYSLYDFSVLAD